LRPFGELEAVRTLQAQRLAGEPHRVEHDLGDRPAGGDERLDVADDPEHRVAALQDLDGRDPDAPVRVADAADARRRAARPADVDAEDQRPVGLDLVHAAARGPGARRQPPCRADTPPATVNCSHSTSETRGRCARSSARVRSGPGVVLGHREPPDDAPVPAIAGSCGSARRSATGSRRFSAGSPARHLLGWLEAHLLKLIGLKLDIGLLEGNPTGGAPGVQGLKFQ
jgi:hypothetical protein